MSCVCAAVPVCLCRWCQQREDVRARCALRSRGQPDVLSGLHIAVKEKKHSEADLTVRGLIYVSDNSTG